MAEDFKLLNTYLSQWIKHKTKLSVLCVFNGLVTSPSSVSDLAPAIAHVTIVTALHHHSLLFLNANWLCASKDSQILHLSQRDQKTALPNETAQIQCHFSTVKWFWLSAQVCKCLLHRFSIGKSGLFIQGSGQQERYVQRIKCNSIEQWNV